MGHPPGETTPVRLVVISSAALAIAEGRTNLALSQSQESHLDTVSTVRGSGWVDDQQCELLLI